MKKDVYVYTAVLTIDDGVSVEFPDLQGCLTCGDTVEEAMKMAKEALGLHMYGLEEDGDAIPEPTLITDIKLENNQIPVLIEVVMPLMRRAVENQAVKKTLTIKDHLYKHK